MKKILLALFIIVSAIGIAAGTTTKKNTSKSTATSKKVATDQYVGWWYYDGNDPKDIEITGGFPNVYYIGKDKNGYYWISYKNSTIKEKNKPNEEVCKEDSRDWYDPENQYSTESDLKISKYERKLTKQELLNLKENLKSVKQSQELCAAR
jgi:lipopolysaccharide export LptBFGC system permease protein LptF